MTIRMKSSLFLLSILALCTAMPVHAQIPSGKIVYERKTNLYKKFKNDDWITDYVKEIDKIKTDIFELYFNDTASMFGPQESELKESFSWTTEKNTVYQNFRSHKRLTIKSIWGDKIYVADSLYKRKWKITESKR